MKTRWFLWLVAGLVCWIEAVAGEVRGADVPARPNIVVILTDDMGFSFSGLPDNRRDL